VADVVDAVISTAVVGAVGAVTTKAAVDAVTMVAVEDAMVDAGVADVIPVDALVVEVAAVGATLTLPRTPSLLSRILFRSP